MIDHLTVTAADLSVSAVFYDAALGALGWQRLVDYVDPEDEDEAGIEAVGYGDPDDRIRLWLVAGSTPTTGVHFAVAAGSVAEVERFHQAGLANGGRSAQAPRRWEIYRPGYFGAIVADPAGNLVEALSARPTP